MYVTTYIDTNSLVFLFKVASLGHQPDLAFATDFLRYINLLSELLDEYDCLVSVVEFGLREPLNHPAPSVQALKDALFPVDNNNQEQSLHVLEAFLWSA